jgi:hypothetical protein
MEEAQRSDEENITSSIFQPSVGDSGNGKDKSRGQLKVNRLFSNTTRERKRGPENRNGEDSNPTSPLKVPESPRKEDSKNSKVTLENGTFF